MASRARITKTAQYCASSPQKFILGTGMCVCTAVYPSFTECPLSVLFFIFRTLHQCCRSERDIASKVTTAQGNHLSTISSWHYQVACCTKSLAPSCCPLHTLFYSCASEVGGVNRPLSGALVRTYSIRYKSKTDRVQQGSRVVKAFRRDMNSCPPLPRACRVCWCTPFWFYCAYARGWK